MPHLYIHIPFCKQACSYCDFHFSTSQKNKAELVKAICKEIILQKDYLNDENRNTPTLKTIYFGGGTPSLLDEKELKLIFDTIKNNFQIPGDAEITLEANPDDLNDEKLIILKEAGVNRLSVGVQSFLEDDLRFMNRAHNAVEANACILSAFKAGFKNISVDFIYGTPTLSDEQWLKNLKTVLTLPVQHLSCYCLTVEEGTALSHQVKTGKSPAPDDEKSSKQFEMLMDFAPGNNFVHYEISNFCKEGFYSKHNTSYWKNEKYLGVGPSAHSYNGVSRQWNVANNARYLKSLAEGNIPFEKENLTADQKYNEYIMTSLRTMWGTDVNEIEKLFGKKMKIYFLKQIAKYRDQNSIRIFEDNYSLTRKGKLMADAIASDLFITKK